MFAALAAELGEAFPTKEQRHDVEGQFEVKDGKIALLGDDTSVFGGVRATSVDRTISLQFRPDGFTLNNVKIYMGGDQLVDKALTYWELLVQRAKPESVSRVALRYINHLELSLKQGDKFTQYFTSPPELPKGAPQMVSQFLSRIVGHDTEREATAIVTQKLEAAGPAQPLPITVDVDVFRTGHFPVDVAPLREILASLRTLKNDTFFSLLTDKTVGFYE